MDSLVGFYAQTAARFWVAQQSLTVYCVAPLALVKYRVLASAQQGFPCLAASFPSHLGSDEVRTVE